MDAQPRTRQPHASMSADEFMAWSMEQPEGCRYELSGGEIFQMASERARHADVKGEVFAQLRDSARKSGRDLQVFTDGMAVKIDGDVVYQPDAAVRFGPKLKRDAARYEDPVIVVEVLSPSSQHLDTAGKLADYFKLPSLQHYLILDADKDCVIHHQRDGADIRTRLVSSGTLALDPPGLTLDVPTLFA